MKECAMRVLSYVLMFLGLSGLGLSMPGAAPAAPAPKKEVPVTTTTGARTPDGLSITKLPNGLTVAIQQDDRFPLVALRLYVHAGSAYEAAKQAGISHQLEHMVFKGTEKRPKGAVAADVEKAGGYLNAATSFDYTMYLTDMPADQWALGLDVLKDMAFHPSLDPQELESEKKVVLAELQRGEDSPGNRLFKRIQARALAGTPYERPIIGYPETIKDYTVEGIRAYIAEHYQPQSMLLVVVGNVDPATVLAEATRLFGDIPNTKAVSPPATLPLASMPAKGPMVSVEKTPWNKVHLGIAFPAYDQNDARSPALEVLAQLLAGDKTSYLYRTYKYDKRLVDSISAGNYAFERTGLFYISVTLAPDKLAPFWEAFTKDMADISRLTFTQQELDRAKLNLEDGLYRQKETLSGLASKLGYFLFFGGPEAENNYLTQLKLTDQATLTALMKDIFTADRLSVAALLPENPAAAGTESAGKAPAAEKTVQPLPDEAWLQKTLTATWPKGAAVAAKESAQAKGATEILDLGSGRTLILLPDSTLPYAAMDMVFTGGDSLLKPDQQGLATLTASVLSRGTASMAAPALDEFLADRAAALGASSGRQTFSLSMRYPSRFAPDLFGLLADVLTKPALAEEELSRAKQNQEAAIISQEDQPLGHAFRRIYPFLFGTHPYGYVQTGTVESVKGFTQSDVRAFWGKQSQQPWVMAVSGTFDREAVIAAAKALPAPKGKSIALKAPAWGKDKTLDITLKGRQQAHLLLVFPGVAASSADEPGLELLQNILAGQSGLLFRDLRDKQGLGYTVTAFMLRMPLTGALVLYIGTEPDKLAQAEQGFRTVIADLHNNLLPDEELQRGKNQMTGEYNRNRQTLGARSQEAATLAATGRPITAERDLVDKAAKITAQDLQNLVRRYLNLEAAYTVKVLP